MPRVDRLAQQASAVGDPDAAASAMDDAVSGVVEAGAGVVGAPDDDGSAEAEDVVDALGHAGALDAVDAVGGADGDTTGVRVLEAPAGAVDSVVGDVSWRPSGGPGSTGGSFGGRGLSGVAATIGTVIPTSRAYTCSSAITVDT